MFPASDRPLENVVTRNIFWVICNAFFFFFSYRKSWPEVLILFQNLRSELVYTFKWTKFVARLWRNQICEWTEKKKFPYLPTHRWNGGSGAGNEHIFKGGLSAYHHWCCGFESRSGWGVQHYMIKFVSDLRQIGGFPRVLRFPPPIKLTSTI